MELMRGLSNQLTELISGLAVQDLAPMSLGLCVYMVYLTAFQDTSKNLALISLSKCELQKKITLAVFLYLHVLIVQAISLLDDLDKELNTYAMRLAKIVQDNILYAKTVKLMGDRTNATKLDFSEVLDQFSSRYALLVGHNAWNLSLISWIFPEEVEAELKGAAMISMGTEVSDIHLMNIKDLCNQLLSFSEYTAQLYDYLKSRMNTIAPNLTALVLRFLNTPNQMR
nr:probable nucleolar protein 5-2 [Ipomoea batatas]